MISYHTHIPVYARTYAPWLGSFGATVQLEQQLAAEGDVAEAPALTRTLTPTPTPALTLPLTWPRCSPSPSPSPEPQPQPQP